MSQAVDDLKELIRERDELANKVRNYETALRRIADDTEIGSKIAIATVVLEINGGAA